MNLDKHIEFVEWQQLPMLYNAPWWDVPRWWLVRLLGGQCPHDTVKVTRVPVGGKDFMEQLWKQKRALVESFHREPTTMWIGAEEYEKLMSSPPIRMMLTVNAEFHYGEHEIYGLRVKVVPWMRGILVMPT